jgi:plasmid stabilization system protein ParE
MKVIIEDSAKEDIRTIRKRLKPFGNIPIKKFTKSLSQFYETVSSFSEGYPVFEPVHILRFAVLVYDYIAFYKVEKESKKVKLFQFVMACYFSGCDKSDKFFRRL